MVTDQDGFCNYVTQARERGGGEGRGKKVRDLVQTNFLHTHTQKSGKWHVGPKRKTHTFFFLEFPVGKIW